MKPFLPIIVFFLLAVVAFSQDPQPNFVLKDPIPSNETKEYIASEYIQMIPNFWAHPYSGNYHVSAKIDPLLVFPPDDGDDTGGPNPGDDGVVGVLPGSLTVSQAGAAIYSVPIEIPPGVSGMTPELGLIYNSMAGDGIMGPGWSLSGISTISNVRSSVYYSDWLIGNENSYFNHREFILDGQRLIAQTSETYPNCEYRTENDIFTKIVQLAYGTDGWYFKAYSKSGLTYFYGSTDDSRHRGNATGFQSQRAVLNYFVSKIEDRFGNAINFEYDNKPATGECYINKISYANGYVQFNYEDRIDPLVTRLQHHGANIEFKVAQRLKSIISYYNNQIYRTYDLHYKTRDVTFNYYLDEIQLIGEGDTKFNKTVFSWTSKPTYDPTLFEERDLLSKEGEAGAGDFDGDGLMDIFIQTKDGENENDVYVYRNNGDFTFSQVYFIDGHTGHTNQNVRMGDINGDGLTDIVIDYIVESDLHFYAHLYLNKGDFTFQVFPDIVTSESFPFRIDLGDFDGDGLTDILPRYHYCWYGNHDPDHPLIYKRGFIWPSVDPGNLQHMTYLFADFNGNGRTDLLELNNNGNHQLFINELAKFSYANEITNSELPFVENDQVTLGDFNGDMLADLCIIKNFTDFYIHQSFGQGFIATVHNHFSLDNSLNSYGHVRFDIGNFNGDNRSDITRTHYWCEQDENLTWRTKSDIDIFTSNISGTNLREIWNSIPSSNEETEYATTLVADLNGDGKSEIFGNIYMQIDAFNLPYKWRNNIEFRIFSQINTNPDVIVSIRNSIGVNTDINYKSLIGDARVSGSKPVFPIAYLPGSVYVVDEVFSNGPSYQESTSYAYNSPRIHIQGKGFLGFLSTKTSTFSDGTHATFFSTLVENEIDEDYYFLKTTHISNLYSTNETDEKKISETFNQYDIIRFPNGLGGYRKNYFPYLSKTLTKEYEADGSFVKVSRTDNTYNNWGDLTSSHILKDDSPLLSLNSSESSFKYREINTNIYKPTDEENWVLGRLETVYVKQISPNANEIARTSYFVYYSDPADKRYGMLKSESEQPWDTDWFKKEYTYDNKGNLEKTTMSGTNQEQRTYTTTYDDSWRFIESNENSLNQFEYRTYDQLSGKVSSFTDLNGLVTSFKYDGFGRLIETTNPDKTKSLRSIRWVAEGDLDAPANALYFSWAKSSGGPESKEYFDKYGRVLRTVNTGFNHSKIYIDKIYYNNSQLKKISDPYFAASSVGDIQYTEYKYDELNRLVEVIAPGNRLTVTEYDGLSLSITNAAGQSNTKVYNAAGWLIEAKDALQKSITYKYFSNGKLWKIIDSKNNATEMSYDIFGNRNYLKDPDLGETHFTYNVYGELVEKIDANMKTSIYQYDKLGRLFYRSEFEGTTSWIYDIAENGVGKIAEVHGPNVSEFYYYDELSRLESKDEIIEGETFTTSSTYDILGRPETFTYPSSYEIRNIYDNNSYLKQVRQPSNNKLLWEAREINAKGQFVEFGLGNGLTTYYDYYEETGLIESIETPGIQHLGFEWWEIPNLRKRSDLLKNDVFENYDYDDLNRLRYVLKGGVQKCKIDYDELGNITYKSDVGDYIYDGLQPHAVSKINGRSLPISSLLQTITYASFSKITHIEEGENSLEIMYGISHERKKMTLRKNHEVTKEKFYISGGVYEKIIEGDVVKEVHYISGGSGLFAIYTKFENKESSEGHVSSIEPPKDEMKYIHTDHLGSIQSISNEAGLLVEEFSYDAWGVRRDPNTWEKFTEPPQITIDRGFTGHEHLDLFELVNMNGRMYDPVIGRFLSADPFMQMPEFTQGLNRYSYCMNNPLSAVDPSGYFMNDAGFTSFIGFIAGVIVSAAVTFGSGGAALPAVIGAWAGFAAGFTGGALYASMNGATFSQAMSAGLMGGAVGAAMGAVTAGIGNIAIPCSGTAQITQASLDFVNLLIRSSAHGIVSGGMSLLQGGRFEHGLMAAFFSSMGMGGAGAIKNLGAAGYMLLGAAIGGTAESLGGGKFANGAVTGAFIGLLNDAMHQEQLQENKQNFKKLDPTSKDAGNELVKLMARINKEKLSGDISEIIDYSNVDIEYYETFKVYESTYDDISVAKISVVQPLNLKDTYFYRIGTENYQRIGRAAYGSFTIQGQYGYISLKIYNENAYWKAYDQIFKE